MTGTTSTAAGERTPGHLDALCGLLADAARLEKAGRLDDAVTRWACELAAPADVVSLVEQARRELPASRRRAAVLERVAVLGVTAVAERLVREALTDPLTGLASRRRMQDEVQHLIALSERGGRALTAVLLDVDGLKRINDKLGHQAGDAALAEVGRSIREHLRKADRAYRWGGDEFLLVLTTDAAEAQVVVERILACSTTALSFGLAQHTGDASDAAVAAWLQDADADLYERRRELRALIPAQRGRGARPVRHAALAGLATAAAVTVGWTGVNAAFSHSPRPSTPRQAAAQPRLPGGGGSLTTPGVATREQHVVAPPVRVRTTPTSAKPARAVRRTTGHPAVVVPGVVKVPVPVLPAVPDVPVLPTSPPDPGLVQDLLTAVGNVVHKVLPV